MHPNPLLASLPAAHSQAGGVAAFHLGTPCPPSTMSLPSLLEANGDVTYVLGFIFLVAMAFSLRKLWKLLRA